MMLMNKIALKKSEDGKGFNIKNSGQKTLFGTEGISKFELFALNLMNEIKQQGQMTNSEIIKFTIVKELTDTEKYGENNEYSITLVSLNKKFKNNFEPFSASYEARIKSLKHLHNNGLNTWVSMEPYPIPSLSENQDLLAILKKISFVDKIIFGKLNYNVKVPNSQDNKDFYNKCANTVIDFCEKHKIEHRIKYGTKKKDNRNTEKIFRKFPTENRIKLCNTMQV